MTTPEWWQTPELPRDQPDMSALLTALRNPIPVRVAPVPEPPQGIQGSLDLDCEHENVTCVNCDGETNRQCGGHRFECSDCSLCEARHDCRDCGSEPDCRHLFQCQDCEGQYTKEEDFYQ